MKRSLFTALAVLLAGSLFAGGIVTNTNQSAMYTRMGNRAATVGIDAVYYNPAGLTKLGNGFHFSINNQTIGQTRTVTTDYSSLLNYRDPDNNGEYTGEVSAPLFPGVYGVFKIGKWAFSAGFNPVGGGGSATYKTGLPSFEYLISDLTPALMTQGQDIRGYMVNAYFDGSSVFYGLQANVSYAINDMISVALGGRYVMANEKYSGYLKEIQLNNAGTWVPAPLYFSQSATAAAAAAAAAAGASTAVQTEVAGGALLTDPLTNAVAIGTLTSLGVNPAGMTNAVAIGTLNAMNAGYTEGAAQATTYSNLLVDQDVDAEKTASGFTPIVSVNIQPIEMLNIAVKYELKTSLEFTTSVAADKRGLIGVDNGVPVYMFTDGQKTNLDMPAYLSVGATLRPIKSLLVAGYYGYFFDKDANWDGREKLLESNSFELGLGAEYSISEKFLVSAGWLMTQTGATSDYQTDMSYSLSTQGFNVGFAWDILPLLQLNVGGQYVMYADGENKFEHDFASQGVSFIPVTEKLQKSVWAIGVGVNITLASKGK
jgi:long-chain fatty acid transport protein